MKTIDKPVIVEQTFNTSIHRVWDALTKLDEMKTWFFNAIESFVPEKGFETEFVVQVENRTFTHLWKITEVIPGKKIVYNWKYKEYPGDSFVTFELSNHNSNTKLKLTTEVIEDFASNIPEFTRESCENGWNYFIKESLKNYLELNR
ncbi:MAG TPA: SRPBCC domain-containing protein [Flavobacteriaceae bacterium]|nr:SRPBCC domain-containing protein [Flavobacteriaceae bacterium]